MDGRTDGQTSFHGIVHTMHTHRAVKTRCPGLLDDENRMILQLLVLSQYQHVPDRQTDTPPIAESRSSVAECDKTEDNTSSAEQSQELLNWML